MCVTQLHQVTNIVAAVREINVNNKYNLEDPNQLIVKLSKASEKVILDELGSARKHTLGYIYNYTTEVPGVAREYL